MKKAPWITIESTCRGFALSKFGDIYDAECSIQESSLAGTDAIWVGVHENRMHLDRELVADLLPILERFVRTGQLRVFKKDQNRAGSAALRRAWKQQAEKEVRNA